MPNTDTDIRVLVSAEHHRSSQVVVATARVVYLAEDGSVRNFLNDDFHYGQFAGLDYFADLTVRAQCNTTDAGEFYGTDVSYSQPYQVKLRDAEKMVKTLRKIEKGLARIEQSDGRPLDFIEYVRRFEKILKIQKVLGWRAGAGAYRWDSVDQVRYNLNSFVSEIRTANGVEAAR